MYAWGEDGNGAGGANPRGEATRPWGERVRVLAERWGDSGEFVCGECGECGDVT